MKKNLRTKLKRMLEKETDERVLIDVLEYVKVIVAYRKYIDKISKKPPSPEVWQRMPRWKQLQIVLICELFYRLHLLKKWFSEQRESWVQKIQGV